MTKIHNMTLDGDAIRLVGYLDHHGEDRYDLEFIAGFDRRGLTREELTKFALGILNDCSWGGVFNICADDFTEPTLKAFIGGANDSKEDGA